MWHPATPRSGNCSGGSSAGSPCSPRSAPKSRKRSCLNCASATPTRAIGRMMSREAPIGKRRLVTDRVGRPLAPLVMASPIILLIVATSRLWDTRSDPLLDVAHHLLLAEVVEEVVIVTLVELERLVFGSSRFVEELAAMTDSGLVVGPRSEEHT